MAAIIQPNIDGLRATVRPHGTEWKLLGFFDGRFAAMRNEV